jgi:hypothetical protein
MFKKFWRAEQGNYAVITAVAMVPLLTAVGGAVDYSITTNEASNLQSALDSAALAIGARYTDDMTEDQARQIGNDYFTPNLSLLDPQEAPLDYHGHQETGANGRFLITVSSSIVHPGFIGGFDWPITRTSVAAVSSGEPACVLALNKHASKALEIQGSTNVAMAGCVVASNSDALDSLYRSGSARLAAKCAVARGGISGLGDSNTKLDCPAPLANQHAMLDPLAGVEPPAYGTCEPVNGGGKTTELKAGTYCGKTINGNVTLTEAGNYIFKGGKIQLGGNGSLVGHGVTIFLMEGAELSINANQLVTLSPPATGPYAGITVYQARGNTTELKLNGGAGSSINGFIYAPDAAVTYTGNSTTASDACLRIVGDTVTMIGNSTVKSDCTTELGGRKMYAGRMVALID